VITAADLTGAIETKLVHAGERPRVAGAVTVPVFQSAMFEYTPGEGYHDQRYIRLNNTPNHWALHRKLAALEGAEASLVTASGMAAVSTALLTVLAAGDHLLIQDSLYGGTNGFVTQELPAFGITYDFVSPDDTRSWESKLRETTKAIYVESMSNPLLVVPDLAGAVAFARKHRLVSLIDNTFATPVNFRPAEHGFDLSIHSGTKYLNGHSDIVAGAIIGSASLISRIKHRLDHLGGSLDPHACFLLQRGIKTLALRVRFQQGSALELARFLESHPAVARVNYAGLESHPGHVRAAGLFEGFGGVLSFEPDGGVEAAERFMARVRLPIVAPSLGGVESLVTRPATTSHAGMPAAERQRSGISDALIRVSVGIEATRDLIDDFAQALAE
jgi:cystathionine beta-lyase/cystathionine gamma-synthase